MRLRGEGRLRLHVLFHYLWACTTRPLSDVLTLQSENPRRFSRRRMKNEAIGCTSARISGKTSVRMDVIARQVAFSELEVISAFFRQKMTSLTHLSCI